MEGMGGIELDTLNFRQQNVSMLIEAVRRVGNDFIRRCNFLQIIIINFVIL